MGQVEEPCTTTPGRSCLASLLHVPHVPNLTAVNNLICCPGKMHLNPPQKVPMTHPRYTAQNASHEVPHSSPAVPLKTECPEWGEHGRQSSPHIPEEGGREDLHSVQAFPRHPLERHDVLSCPWELWSHLSQSSHGRDRTQACHRVRAEPRTDGAPQQLTSQLRSLSLVTVRSAKSPRLTSPPPIVSMMKTSS